jgi:hypothetical protein
LIETAQFQPAIEFAESVPESLDVGGTPSVMGHRCFFDLDGEQKRSASLGLYETFPLVVSDATAVRSHRFRTFHDSSL